MKKSLSALVLLLALVLCLAACGEKTPGDTTPPVTTPPVTTPPVTNLGDYMEAFIGFPYHNSNISEYAGVPRDAYVSFEVLMDVTDADVSDSIAELLAAYPIEIKVTDRAVKEGDLVYLYYEGSIDGVLFSGGSNMNDEAPYMLEIGSGSFIPGFEEALVGMIPDDTLAADVYIDVTFPTDYHAASLAGKAAKFRVQIESIVDGYEDRTELTPAFLKELGYETKESDVVAAFRADLKADMRLEIADNYDRLLRERLIELVSPSLAVTKLPETELARLKKLVVDEVNSCFADYGYYYGIETIDEFAVFWLGLEAGADWMAEVDRYATDKIKQTLVLYAIAENEAITVSETRFAEVLNKLAEENHLPQIEIIRRGGADVVYDEAIFLAVTDLLIARATVDNGELPLDND